MDTSLLSLYIKLNVLLAAALVLWFATRSLARGLGFESSHAQQLKVARLLFLGLLGTAAIALFAYGWLTALATSMTDGVTVVAGIDTNLERNYAMGAVGFDMQTVVFCLLLAGLAWQVLRLTLQVRKLRGIVHSATEWRCISGVHLLVSSEIATPFSTRALGRKHIVLPMTLLESPRNLRLAVKHELQHVRNGDLEWVILLEAVKVLCFWNPAAWLWHNEFDCLQEFACDEALVDRRHVTPHAYGTCLLEVASAHSGNALLAASNMVPKFSWWQDTQSQLKRRITMLTSTRGKKYQALRSLGYALLAGVGMVQTALVVFAADAGSVTEDRSDDARPLVRINPDYPQQALSQGFEGWVNIEFTITETGAVVDPVVIDNCAGKPTAADDGDDCPPDDIFNSSALAAVAKWRYEPRIENGAAVAREGVQTIIRFTLEDHEGCELEGENYAVGAKLRRQGVATLRGQTDPEGVVTAVDLTCVVDANTSSGYGWRPVPVAQ